jgi:hypothetical protein
VNFNLPELDGYDEHLQRGTNYHSGVMFWFCIELFAVCLLSVAVLLAVKFWGNVICGRVELI